MIWGQLTQWMALGPLAALVLLAARGRARDRAWWLLASAFAISWATDALALSFPPAGRSRWVLSALYPALQASLVGAALIARRARAAAFALLTHWCAGVSILFHGVEGPEYVSRIVAWGTLATLAWRFEQLGPRLRFSLLVYFGAGLALWVLHAHVLSLWTWFPYQLARLGGLALFCAAVLPERSAPALRVLRGRAA